MPKYSDDQSRLISNEDLPLLGPLSDDPEAVDQLLRTAATLDADLRDIADRAEAEGDWYEP